jgi:hypothetical protein
MHRERFLKDRDFYVVRFQKWKNKSVQESKNDFWRGFENGNCDLLKMTICDLRFENRI